MADIAFIVAVTGFFGLCLAYVRGLNRVIRSTEETSFPAKGLRGNGGMSADNWIGLVVAVALIVYLAAALLFPERI